VFAGGGYGARGIEGAYGSWGPEWSGNQETDGVGWDGEVEKLWKLENYGDGWGGGATERGTTGGRGKGRTGAAGCCEGRVAGIAKIIECWNIDCRPL